MERTASKWLSIWRGRLNLINHLSQWRSVDDLCSQLSFQPSFKVALHWILERLVEMIASRRGPTGTLVSTIFATRCGNPISKTCVRQLCKSILRTRQLWIYWIARRTSIPWSANGEQSGDRNLLGPQGVPLWLNYFHNDNLTYAVNNWVGAALAAERVSRQRTFRVLEIGAGPGSASEILLRLFDERGLLPRVERYLVTEPNAFFLRCAQRKLASNILTFRSNGPRSISICLGALRTSTPMNSISYMPSMLCISPRIFCLV